MKNPMNRLRSMLTLATALAILSSVALAAGVLHDLTGRWTFSVVTDNGTGTPTVVLKQVGEKLTGTYESRMLGTRGLVGEIKGDSLRFVLSNDGGTDTPTLTFVGTVVDADNLKGLVDFGGMGSATFTAKREAAKP